MFCIYEFLSCKFAKIELMTMHGHNPDDKSTHQLFYLITEHRYSCMVKQKANCLHKMCGAFHCTKTFWFKMSMNESTRASLFHTDSSNALKVSNLDIYYIDDKVSMFTRKEHYPTRVGNRLVKPKAPPPLPLKLAKFVVRIKSSLYLSEIPFASWI